MLGNPFFQPPCALALLLCAWRLFCALGCGGVGEVAYMVGFRCGAVASALLRQSRDTAEALSEMFLVAPCALSECRAHSLGLLQYSQHLNQCWGQHVEYGDYLLIVAYLEAINAKLPNLLMIAE